MIQNYERSESDDATSEEIAEQITASRHRIDSQLHRLAQCVTPQAILQNATEKLADRSVDETMDTLSHYYAKVRAYVRKRPLGAALLAIGVVAMILESSNGERKNGARESQSRPDPRRDYDI